MNKNKSKAERIAEVKRMEEKWLTSDERKMVRKGKKLKIKKKRDKSVPGQAAKFVQGGKVSPR